jgi:hypothetical protein
VSFPQELKIKLLRRRPRAIARVIGWRLDRCGTTRRYVSRWRSSGSMTGPTADMAWHADDGSAAAVIGPRRERGSASGRLGSARRRTLGMAPASRWSTPGPTGISNTKARWPSSSVPAGGTQTLPWPWHSPDRRRVKIRLSDPGTVHRGLEPSRTQRTPAAWRSRVPRA